MPRENDLNDRARALVDELQAAAGDAAELARIADRVDVETSPTPALEHRLHVDAAGELRATRDALGAELFHEPDAALEGIVDAAGGEVSETTRELARLELEQRHADRAERGLV